MMSDAAVNSDDEERQVEAAKKKSLEESEQSRSGGDSLEQAQIVVTAHASRIEAAANVEKWDHTLDGAGGAHTSRSAGGAPTQGAGGLLEAGKADQAWGPGGTNQSTFTTGAGEVCHQWTS